MLFHLSRGPLQEGVERALACELLGHLESVLFFDGVLAAVQYSLHLAAHWEYLILEYQTEDRTYGVVSNEDDLVR